MDKLKDNQTAKNKNLESRLLRDRIAEVGLFAGCAAGVGYWLLTKDSYGTPFFNSVGFGGVGGAGFAYCIGTIIRDMKLLYAPPEKYKNIEKKI
jgi:hypothetical protein